MEIEKFSRKKYSQNVIQGLFTQALFLSMREENAKENEKISDAINNAISYIDQYYNTDIDLDELAKSSGYCTDRFRNLFKIATGEAPKKYILKKRLNYAKVLILEGHNDMNEISNMLGFKHYTRFSLFFKEETGLSPKEYKDQYSKN